MTVPEVPHPTHSETLRRHEIYTVSVLLTSYMGTQTEEISQSNNSTAHTAHNDEINARDNQSRFAHMLPT